MRGRAPRQPAARAGVPARAAGCASSSSLLDAHRGLPELLDAGLVVGRPLPVVVHQADLIERRCAGRGRDVLTDRATVRELHVEVARLLREHPVDERLSAGKVLRALDDADGTDLEAGVLRDVEVDLAGVLRL